MSKLEELRKKQVEIEAEIEAVRKEERKEALKTVRKLCKEHGFTAGMLKAVLAPGRKSKK